MKDASHVQWARHLLDDQLERLSELRNASPRDPGFKLWRQTTLTVIQRIWPGDLARCERFRRVPFSSTSPRQNRAQTREHFERGCAEASAYLRILTLELETQGLNKSGAPAADSKPAQLPAELAQPAPAAAEPPPHPHDMFEPSPFDRIQTPAPATPETAVPTPPPAPEPPAPKPQAQASAPPPQQAPPPPSSVPAASPPAQKGRRPGGQQLKDMLGFGAEGARTKADGPASFASPAPPPAFARDHEDVLDPRLEAMLAEAEESAFDAEGEEVSEESAPTAEREEPPPPAQSASPGDLPISFIGKSAPAPPPPTPAPPVASKPAAPAPAPAATKPRPVVVKASTPSPSPEARAPETVLPDWATPTAPVPPLAAPAAKAPAAKTAAKPQATPQPQTPAPSPTPAPQASSPTSVALMAIAAQVDRLGVPEGQRASARDALIDFAKQLDEGIASWDSIREILWIIADYPALARRTIPLLIPHLDLE